MSWDLTWSERQGERGGLVPWRLREFEALKRGEPSITWHQQRPTSSRNLWWVVSAVPGVRCESSLPHLPRGNAPLHRYNASMYRCDTSLYQYKA